MALVDIHVPAEVRDRVWARLNGEGEAVQAPVSYFAKVTRNFASEGVVADGGGVTAESSSERPPPRTTAYWGWDVFQGYITPSLVHVATFESHAEAVKATQRLLGIEALKNEHIHRLLCYTGPIADGCDATRVCWAVELPPKQHSVRALALENIDEPGWDAAVAASVASAAAALAPLGLAPSVEADAVFLRGGKPGRAYVTNVQLVRATVEDALVHCQGGDALAATYRRRATVMIRQATTGGLLRREDSMPIAVGVAPEPPNAAASFSVADADEPASPLAYERVGNCPVVLREVCGVCRELVKSAGFHMRGAQCSRTDRHFFCETCVNASVERRLTVNQLDIESLPCFEDGCAGKLDFDDYGALLDPRLLRDWNVRGRAAVLRQVEEDVNRQLRAMTNAQLI